MKKLQETLKIFWMNSEIFLHNFGKTLKHLGKTKKKRFGCGSKILPGYYRTFEKILQIFWNDFVVLEYVNESL